MMEKMINYLQSMMDDFKNNEAKYDFENEIAVKIVYEKLNAMIACKEMVEALIGEPVNLGHDGKVTVGF